MAVKEIDNRGLVQAKGLPLSGPQVPFFLEPGQGLHQVPHRVRIGLRLQGLGHLPDGALPGKLNLFFTPFQGDGGDLRIFVSKDLFGPLLAGFLLCLVPPQPHISPRQDQENHHIGNQPAGAHFLALRVR